MKNNAGEHVRDLRKTKNVLISLLIGSLTGAAVMLLFAPQSGKQTRAWIYQGPIRLRDRMEVGGMFAALDAGKTAVKAA